jgi:inner membrane protein involved in colicin E2 resistance
MEREWIGTWRRTAAMERKETRKLGLSMVVAGLGVIVFAVLLVGLTKEGGGIDWISIITALAGAAMVGTGLFTIFRKIEPGSASNGPAQHAAS